MKINFLRIFKGDLTNLVFYFYFFKILFLYDRYDLRLHSFQFLYIGVSSPSCGKNPPDCDYKCQAAQLNHFSLRNNVALFFVSGQGFL